MKKHDAALARARIIATGMAGEWGEPILADSGNGAHLLYKVHLPNDQDALKLVTGTLAALDRRYSDADLRKGRCDVRQRGVDPKAYGTAARKGDSIPGRPHRISRRPRGATTSRESLARSGRDDLDPLGTQYRCWFWTWIVGYLAAHDFTVTRRKPWSSQPGGSIYELAQCPFDPTHTGGSAAFTFVDGRPGFQCHHNGCLGKGIQDVFALYSAQKTSAARPNEAHREVFAGANWPTGLKGEAHYGIAGELVRTGLKPHSEAGPGRAMIHPRLV